MNKRRRRRRKKDRGLPHKIAHKIGKYAALAIIVCLGLIVSHLILLSVIGLVILGVIPHTWPVFTYVIMGGFAKLIDGIIDMLISKKLSMASNSSLKQIKHRQCMQTELDLQVHLGSLILATPKEDWAIILAKLPSSTATMIKKRLKALEGAPDGLSAWDIIEQVPPSNFLHPFAYLPPAMTQLPPAPSSTTLPASMPIPIVASGKVLPPPPPPKPKKI